MSADAVMDATSSYGRAPRAASGADTYAPSTATLAHQLPEIGTAIADALAALARCPSRARVNQAAAQVAGAQAYLRCLTEALLREGEAHGR